ncbi:MAG: hypothetical protein JNK14_05735 [Chitinophagaceae bacterium]|nr:hypothetical protein [Chitinophagaceae bacterium]
MADSTKIIVTTSDFYHHCLPVFFKQYAKYWDDPFELVGYKMPDIELPGNCLFVSLGKQRGPDYFGEDMRRYFSQQPGWFVWMMEDTFIKGFNKFAFNEMEALCHQGIGRINLTTEGMKRGHYTGDHLYYVDQSAKYRLSTQPSIWNKEFLLKYMKPGLTPWKFETQETNDDYDVIGPLINIVDHNEGVRKHNINELNLEGID